VRVVYRGCVECCELAFGNMYTGMIVCGYSGRHCSFSASSSYPWYVMCKQCHLVHIPHNWLAYCLYVTHFQ
jgi:hypothetical protein